MIRKRGGMDIAVPDNQKQSISDDQELAKALAGVTQEAEDATTSDGSGDSGITPADGLPAVLPTPTSMADDSSAMPDPTTFAPVNPDPAAAGSSNLADVKQAALTELRPLIGKLDVGPEEKFNTYLLLIRSTDDQSLIAPAHEAAQGITDEAKKLRHCSISLKRLITFRIRSNRLDW